MTVGNVIHQPPRVAVRTIGQIKHKVAQVRFRHLKREVRTALSRRPENCQHNQQSSTGSFAVRVCMLDPTGTLPICDPFFGGLAKAVGCPYFSCANTRDGVKEEFFRWLGTSTIPEVATRYPDLAALFWVLGGEEGDPSVVLPREHFPVLNLGRFKFPDGPYHRGGYLWHPPLSILTLWVDGPQVWLV